MLGRSSERGLARREAGGRWETREAVVERAVGGGDQIKLGD